MLHWARARAELDLSGAGSAAEVAERVGRFHRARSETGPIVGRGWDANGWSEPPARTALDAACESRPVLLYSRDHHNLWLNGAALATLGIGRDTPDPDGGVVGRDAAGEPSGILRDHAMRLAAPLEQTHPDADLARLRGAIAALHACGITAIHDFEGRDAHRLLRRLAAGDGPRVRTLMSVPHAQLDAAIAVGLETGAGDAWFRLGAVKLFADGTLGSRTAALLEPYDGTNETGMDLLAPRELADQVRHAVEHGWSVAIHAIGDRAVRSALDALEAVRERLAAVSLPPRLEHVQLLDPKDGPRFGALGVAASMQPIHCVSDIPLAERWWGSRRERSYPWRSLLESGARLAFGSDAPVEPPSAALGLAAALTRRAPGSARAYVPEQAIDLDAALTAYTETPARLAGTWPRLGSLEVGAEADLVAWNVDLHAQAPDALAAAHPVATVLGGRLVHEAPHAPEAAVAVSGSRVERCP